MAESDNMRPFDYAAPLGGGNDPTLLGFGHPRRPASLATPRWQRPLDPVPGRTKERMLVRITWGLFFVFGLTVWILAFIGFAYLFKF